MLVAVLGIAAMRLVVPIFARDLPLRLLFVISEMTLALPAVLALVWTSRPLSRTLALRPIDRPTALLAAGLGLALWLASLGLLELQYTVWPPPPGYLEIFRRIHEALRPANAFDAAVSVLTIAAAPAIFEEILVRGVVLPSWQRAFGALGALYASTILFAVMHFDLYRLLFTLAVGSVLGVVRLRAGALLPCMLVHGTLNTLTFLVAPLVDDPSEPLPDPRPLLGAALLALGMAATALLLRRLPRDR